MTFEDIAWSREGHLAVVRVARPHKLNAMRLQTVTELHSLLVQLEEDAEIRAVVLTGAGRSFGTGLDLTTVDPAAPLDLDRMLDLHFNPLVERMRASRLPIVCAVNGPCAGASVGIALAGDIVLAGRSAYFLEPFTGLALVPDAGNTVFMTRAAGRIRAAAAMLLGDKVGAAEAQDWGLVWRVTEDDALLREAVETGHRLAQKPPGAMAATKSLIRRVAEGDLSAGLVFESKAQGDACRSAEAARVLDAFVTRKVAGR